MPGKIETELLDVTGENPKRRKEGEQDYLRRLAYATDDLNNEKYDALSAKARDWAEASASAANEKLEIPTIPGRRKPPAEMTVISETGVTVVEEEFLPDEEPGSAATSEPTSEPAPDAEDDGLVECDECKARVDPNEDGASSGARSEVDGLPLWFLCAVCTDAAASYAAQQEDNPDADLDAPDDGPYVTDTAEETAAREAEMDDDAEPETAASDEADPDDEPEVRMCACGAGPLYDDFEQCGHCLPEPVVAPEVEAGPEATAEPEAAAPPAPEPEKKPARKKRPKYEVQTVGEGLPGDLGQLRMALVCDFLATGELPTAETAAETVKTHEIGTYPYGTLNATVRHVSDLLAVLTENGYTIAKED